MFKWHLNFFFSGMVLICLVGCESNQIEMPYYGKVYDFSSGPGNFSIIDSLNVIVLTESYPITPTRAGADVINLTISPDTFITNSTNSISDYTFQMRDVNSERLRKVFKNKIDIPFDSTMYCLIGLSNEDFMDSTNVDYFRAFKTDLTLDGIEELLIYEFRHLSTRSEFNESYINSFLHLFYQDTNGAWLSLQKIQLDFRNIYFEDIGIVQMPNFKYPIIVFKNKNRGYEQFHRKYFILTSESAIHPSSKPEVEYINLNSLFKK